MHFPSRRSNSVIHSPFQRGQRGIAVSDFQRGFARARGNRDKGNLAPPMRRQFDFAAKGHDRVQRPSGAIAQIPVLHGGRPVRVAVPTEKCRPVGFGAAPDDALIIGDQAMQQNGRAFLRPPRPAGEQQSVDIGQEFAVDEHLAEYGVAGGIIARGKNDLAIAGQIERASLVAFIDDGDAANFQIIAVRNADRHVDGDVIIAAMEFHLMRVEPGVHVGPSRPGRFRSYGPEFAGGAVADIDPQARTTGSRRCPDQRMVMPGQLAPAVRGEVRRHTAIADHVHRCRAARRRGYPGMQAGDRACDRGQGFPCLDPLNLGGQYPWNPFIEQQVDSSDMGIGMEPVHEHVVAQGIAQGGQAHAVMMCHVGSHRNKALSFRHASRGEVGSLVKSVSPYQPESSHVPQVAKGQLGPCGKRQRSRIGGHNPVTAQTPSQAKLGDAKGMVVIDAGRPH